MKRALIGCLSVMLFATQAFAMETEALQAIVIDYDTDVVMLEKNADQPMHPSSMSKLMTLYMVFGQLKEGRLKLEDTLPVSEKAWRMGGSKMFVHVGDAIKVEDLIRGIIVQSGNDACVVIAEGLGGSEEAFAAKMTEKAKEIGLKNSHFTNATGWTDDNHLTTARDLAILAKHLIQDFPEYYHYFSEKSFTYQNITQPNRNLLLDRSLGVDGLKTGHTELAGYGITISAKQGDRRVIVVINGMPTEKSRPEEAEKLIRFAFREFENVSLYKPGDRVTEADTWLGKKRTVPLTVDDTIVMTLPQGSKKQISITAKMNEPVEAPIAKGTKLGELIVRTPQGEVRHALKAAEDVERLSYWPRVIQNLKLRLFGYKPAAM